MKKIHLAMIGFGTVAVGVARRLVEVRDSLRVRSGVDLELRWIVVRDPHKVRPFHVPSARIVTDLRPVLEDQEVSIALELMGGVGTAYEVIRQLLESGKHVVTANKAVLAARGRELFGIAHAHGRAIRFEASVAGAIPILDAVSQGLAANRITAITAILNGTTNYVLSAMHDQALPYEEALRRAQELGFAEADPTLDVDGTDAAQKLAILARLAFESLVDPERIARRGLEQVSAADIAYARELGYVIKLLAVARVEVQRLLLRVGPTLVHENRPLGQVRGEYNAIEVVGDAAGDTFYVGKGAGQMPTASSVVAGILDLAIGRGQETFRALRLWEESPPGPVFDPAGAPRSRFYLRYTIVDRPGTLAQIAGILGRQGVSIASVVQHETGEDSIGTDVPLIIMTHRAEQRAVQAALAETDELPIVRQASVWLPVAD